jgi:hypothetical protein
MGKSKAMVELGIYASLNINMTVLENMLDEEKIKLLGRIAFGPEPEKNIRKLIVFGKKRSIANNYVKGYNALDGNRSLKEISKIIGVTSSTLSPILQKWEEIGIVYVIDNNGGKHYKKLFPI